MVPSQCSGSRRMHPWGSPLQLLLPNPLPDSFSHNAREICDISQYPAQESRWLLHNSYIRSKLPPDFLKNVAPHYLLTLNCFHSSLCILLLLYEDWLSIIPDMHPTSHRLTLSSFEFMSAFLPVLCLLVTRHPFRPSQNHLFRDIQAILAFCILVGTYGYCRTD